jgi:hypothetical protein
MWFGCYRSNVDSDLLCYNSIFLSFLIPFPLLSSSFQIYFTNFKNQHLFKFLQQLYVFTPLCHLVKLFPFSIIFISLSKTPSFFCIVFHPHNCHSKSAFKSLFFFVSKHFPIQFLYFSK